MFVFVVFWGAEICKIEVVEEEYISPPLSTGRQSKTPRRCLKPRIGPNPIYAMSFLYIHTLVIKFYL